MKFKFGKWKWGPVIAVLLLMCLAGAVSADEYLGGIPLETVQTDTVTGDLWFDAAPAPNWGYQVVTKTFALPEPAVGNITWARLYISAYCGHMQDQKPFSITNKFDGNGDGIYETTWAEPATSTPYEDIPVGFVFIVDGGNDNSAFSGHGTDEPYKMVNDHMNRVTSDYLMWYDVTNMISSQTVNVNVDTTGSFDGRIKVITLVVAYDDPASDTLTTYWVNLGHDTCSYYTETNFGEAAVGSTTFGTNGLSECTSAVLTIDYMASNNGYYGFPTTENDFEYIGGSPPIAGNFTNIELDRDPDIQGAYSGVDSWDVTDDIDGCSDVILGFARYFPATGTSAFYKIPLAFLVVKSPIPVEAPVADFEADVTSGEAPLTVSFTDLSTNAPTGWAWDFGDEDTTNASMQNPVHTYASAGTYTVKLTATNDGGSDDETKIDYITVTAPPPAPEAAFTASPLVGVAPLSVTFTDQSSGTPTSWIWEYNAGAGWVEFSDETSPTFGFDDAGPYDIRLTVSNAGGSDNLTYSHYVSVATGREPLVTVRSGTVSGDLFVESPTTYPGTEVTHTFALPSVAVGKIQWAKLYVNTYSGSAQNSYALTSTVKFDGNGDGDYDNAGEFLGVETMDIASETNGNSYPLNDHVTKVYSDYEAQYDVTGLITAENPTAYVKSEAISGRSFDGRIKGVTLVAAFNDDDSDTVYYWVNHGHDWSMDPASGQTTFETSGLAAGWTSAESSIRYTSSSDAISYTFNSVSKTGSGSTPYFDGLNIWDVTGEITTGQSSTLAYSSTSGSFKTPLATLKVKYEGPVAGFAATPLAGVAPLQVNFTDESTGIITDWEWDFGDGGTSDQQNATWVYETAGTYTVMLTVSGPGGSDEEEKTDYITVTEPAPEIDFIGMPTTGIAPLTVDFTARNTGGQVDTWTWDFGDGGASDLQNATHVYETAGTYTVNLTATGSGGSDTVIKENYLQVGGAVIEVTMVPASIDFGSMDAGIDETGSSMVSVDVTGGTAWSVTATASNSGYMGTGSVNLANPFELSNDGGDNYQAMTSAFADFLAGTADNDGSGTANVRQAIDAADGPGNYAITVTFTGGFV